MNASIVALAANLLEENMKLAARVKALESKVEQYHSDGTAVRAQPVTAACDTATEVRSPNLTARP